MDLVSIATFITALAALIGAIAGAYEVWAKHRREHPNNSNTGQPSPTRPAPPLTQSQPRQAGLLSSKVARRSVLLGGTALGLSIGIIGIIQESEPLSYLVFLVGNGIILSLCLIGVSQVARWRKVIQRWSNNICLLIVFLLFLFSWIEYRDLEVSSELVSLLGRTYLFSFIIYLTSIYIGRW